MKKVKILATEILKLAIRYEKETCSKQKIFAKSLIKIKISKLKEEIEKY